MPSSPPGVASSIAPTDTPLKEKRRTMADLDTIERIKDIDVDKYKYGFATDIESEKAPKGLSEDIVAFISQKKGEPQWMLDWRLEAYRRWLTMSEPKWARVHHPKIDFQDLYYYAAPKRSPAPR